MSSDYEHYLAGCRSEGAAPLSAWCFRLLYDGYRCRHAKALTDPDPRHLPVSSAALEHLADLVRLGQEIAATVRPDEDEPGTATSGVREPRVTLTPVLTGCAARRLPAPDAPDESFWRT